MLEREMDLWDAPPDAWIGITTNGTVKRDGRLVMGRGVAREARDKFPGLDAAIGDFVTRNGNRLCFFRNPFFGLPYTLASDHPIFTFPVKYHWRDQADLTLIRQSADELNNVAWGSPLDRYYLPRPGCGNGRLQWADVEPVIRFLPDNVIVVHKPEQPQLPIPTHANAARTVEILHA